MSISCVESGVITYFSVIVEGGTCQRNTVRGVVILRVFDGLSSRHPFRYDLVIQQAKTLDDIGMVQLYPQCDLPMKFLKAVREQVTLAGSRRFHLPHKPPIL